MYIDRYTHSLSKYSVYSPQKKKGRKKRTKEGKPYTLSSCGWKRKISSLLVFSCRGNSSRQGQTKLALRSRSPLSVKLCLQIPLLP